MASTKMKVYLEVGQKRTFAGALEWPGWCRSGRDEASALQGLLDYGPRYGQAVRAADLGFALPSDVSTFVVVERLRGNATTDFGAPGLAPEADTRPVDSDELGRLEKILRGCWRALDRSVKKATGKSLRTGPRGGGRQLEGVLEHVLDSNKSYLGQVGWKLPEDDAVDLQQRRRQSLQATLSALRASARGEIPAKGPRGGVRWTPRYFARRVAWHVLDHAWEIEDRLVQE